MRDDPANDACFDPRKQLSMLTEAEAIEFAGRYFDANCAEQDAAYLKEAIVAQGERSMEVTYRHANAGSAIAQGAYGIARLYGEHLERSVAEGLFWLRRAHNNGCAKASVVMCGLYLDGQCLPRNVGKALEYIEPAVASGDPDAQYVLASLLIEGDGVGIDEERAIDLLRKAARNGHARSLALLEENGIPPG